MKKSRRSSETTETVLVDSGTEPGMMNDTGLTPLQIIRTETVISRLPIHNLVKGGEVNIQISQKNENGKVSLHWEVSPSSRFGHPGQLAYKLDTVVINRIIDEVGRPVPRLLKIGTLNQLCKELGSQKGELKKSLQQNAATTISAKLEYKSKDGQERKLEATFSRYGVVFTGETLPNGEKADEIYIIFNDPYLEVLNSAPIRPLNYEYLKQLSPTSQRFYEIISYRIYAAIKYKQAQAKLLYSEYCTYSAQRRHDDFEHARIQMYRVHKPHLESKYIDKVNFEKLVDAEGKADWMIYYTPGQRAKIEYQTFNRRKSAAPVSELDDWRIVEESVEDIEPSNAIKEKNNAYSESGELVKHFHKLLRGKQDYWPNLTGREVKQASAMLEIHGWEKAVYIVEFAIRESRKTNFRMRTFGAVLQYVSEAEHEFEMLRTSQQFQPKIEEGQVERLRLELEAYQQAERDIERLPEPEFRSLYERVKDELLRRHPAVRRQFDESALDTTVRAGMIKMLLMEENQRGEQLTVTN